MQDNLRIMPAGAKPPMGSYARTQFDAREIVAKYPLASIEAAIRLELERRNPEVSNITHLRS